MIIIHLVRNDGSSIGELHHSVSNNVQNNRNKKRDGIKENLVEEH